MRARVGPHAFHLPRMLKHSSMSAFCRHAVSHDSYSGSFFAYAVADRMSVVNHLSLVDWMTVKPSHERPGAACGSRCPRPAVQFPKESGYDTGSSSSAASISI